MQVYQVSEGERQRNSISRGIEYEAAYFIQYIAGSSEERIYRVQMEGSEGKNGKRELIMMKACTKLC